MMTVCVLYMNECLSEGLFLCTAGLLHILLTGMNVFRSSRAKIRKEEGSDVEKVRKGDDLTWCFSIFDLIWDFILKLP